MKSQYRSKEDKTKFRLTQLLNVGATKENVLLSLGIQVKMHRPGSELWIVEGPPSEDVEDVAASLRSQAYVKSAYPIIGGESESRTIMNNEFIAKFRPEIAFSEVQEINALYGATYVRELYKMPNVYVLEMVLKKDRHVLDVVEMYNRDSRVEYAEPNFGVIAPIPYFPSDGLFGRQWYLHDGLSQDVDAIEAWGIARGEGIKIASFGVGIQLDHWDYQDNILPGADFHPWTQLDPPGRANYIADGQTDDDERCDAHETHAAGLMVAKNDNGGMAGFSPFAKLLPIRLTDSFSRPANQSSPYPCLTDPGYFFDIGANAITWAVDNGADILIWGIAEIPSFSWNHPTHQQAISYAIQQGREGKGCILVASMGNRSNEQIETENYPAMDSLVLAVGSYTTVGKYTHTSGSYKDVAAPGVNILSTDFTGGDGSDPFDDHMRGLSGTSWAGPLTASLAALTLSANSQMTYLEAYNCIRQGAQKWRKHPTLPYDNSYGWNVAGHDIYYGYGRINAYYSLLLAKTLLQNGNFEVEGDTPGQVPTAWSTSGVTAELLEGDGSSHGATAGFRSLKLHSGSGSAYAVVGGLEEGKTYTLTAWFRTPDYKSAILSFRQCPYGHCDMKYRY